MAQIQTKNDPVKHPNHYNWVPGTECVDVIGYFNFNLGSAIKYIWRAPVKDKKERTIDLRKAIFCLNLELARLEVSKD